MIHERPSAESDWAREFPGKLPTVEAVLTIFCAAFLFNKRYRFQFCPNDKVIDIYNGTTGPVADELQLEELAMGLEESFGVDLLANFNESTTLRDIVELVIRPAS